MKTIYTYNRSKLSPGPLTLKQALTTSDGYLDYAILDSNRKIIAEFYTKTGSDSLENALANATAYLQRDAMLDLIWDAFLKEFSMPFREENEVPKNQLWIAGHEVAELVTATSPYLKTLIAAGVVTVTTEGGK